MPQLIKYIDQISREKQRGVLYLEFHPKLGEDDMWGDSNRAYSFKQDLIRKEVLNSITDLGIKWQNCAGIANENCMTSYFGQVYIDVPFDKNLPLYQTLEIYLEHPDGTMRFDTVRFYCLPLEIAMKNARHDKPDFWEKLDEDW